MKNTLDAVIIALCQDFPRRCEAINQGEYGKRTLMEYTYLNHKIYDAAREIVSAEDAPIYISEIGSGTGYANSVISGVSEPTYKSRKCDIKRNIARKLHLTD